MSLGYPYLDLGTIVQEMLHFPRSEYCVEAMPAEAWENEIYGPLVYFLSNHVKNNLFD
jgi:hypothetical protein